MANGILFCPPWCGGVHELDRLRDGSVVYVHEAQLPAAAFRFGDGVEFVPYVTCEARLSIAGALVVEPQPARVHLPWADLAQLASEGMTVDDCERLAGVLRACAGMLRDVEAAASS